MKATITNTSRASQGVHSATGLVFIEPGATREIDVADDYFDRVKSLPFLTLNGKSGASAQTAGDRDANGDTPEMTQLRGMFDQAYGMQGDKLRAADGKVAELEKQVQDKDAEILRLNKLIPETDVDKMTVAELRAHLAYRDIAFDSKKDKKDDLITLAKAAA